jgi:RimJ/RimL family protein N-acetyltransferase
VIEPWARSDGVVTLRPPAPGDAAILIAGRDADWERWLAPGDPEPRPTACIFVEDEIVGWVDAGTDQAWLQPGEVNIGYNVFAGHRRTGYASRAVQLLFELLQEGGKVETAYLVIDGKNTASLAVADSVAAEPIEPLAERDRPNQWFQIDLFSGPTPT